MAFSLSYATFLMLLCSTILLIISLFFFKSDIFSLFSVEELSDFWWLIPISFFSLGLYELFYQWAIRKKEFLLLSKSKILQKSIGSAVQIGLGMASFGSLGLIIGSIFSEAGGLSLFARSFKKDICCNYRFVRWSRMKVILGSLSIIRFTGFLLSFCCHYPVRCLYSILHGNSVQVWQDK